MKKLVLLVSSLLASFVMSFSPLLTSTAWAGSLPVDAAAAAKETITYKDDATYTATPSGQTFKLWTGHPNSRHGGYDNDNSTLYLFKKNGSNYTYSNISGTPFFSGTSSGCNDDGDENPIFGLSTSQSDDRAISEFHNQLITNDALIINGTTAYYMGFRPTPGTSNCTLKIFAVSIKTTKTAPPPANGDGGTVNATDFDWIDAGTIENVAGTNNNSIWDYVANQPSTPLRFYTSQSAGTDSDQQGNCTDYIDVGKVGATTGTYNYRNQSGDQPTGDNTHFDYHINNPSAAQYRTGPDGSGCYSWKFPINLADPDNNSVKPAGTGTGAGAGTVATPNCDAGSLSWIVCSVISSAQAAITYMEKKVQEQLVFSPLEANATTANGTSTLYSVWQSFRNLADVAFVLIFMFVIFGTAFGMDSYTVKKILPRLIAAAIFIQFSYYIVGLLVDITNVLGAGINSLVVLTPAKSAGSASNYAIAEIAGVVAIGGGVVGLAILPAVFIPVLLSVVGVLISLFVAFLTLQLRIILIEVLVVLSPIAFVAAVLPNTEKIFKRWRKALVDLLMMYPVIMMFFLAGTIFSITPSADGKSDSVWQAIIKSLAPAIAFFMIPAAFKVAEGALTKGGDFISKAGAKQAAGKLKSAGDGVRKRREADKKQAAVTRLGGNADTLSNGGTLSPLQKLRARRDMSKAGFGGERSISKMEAQHPQQFSSLLNVAAKAEKEQQEGFERRYANTDFSSKSMDGAALTRMLSGASSAAERKAILSGAAKAKNAAGIEQALNNRYGGNVNNQEYRAGLGKDGISDLATSAPHLIAGSEVYDTMNADKLAGLGKNGWAAAAARANESPAARANLEDGIARIRKSQAMDAKVTDRATMDSILAPLESEPTSTTAPAAASPAAPAAATTESVLGQYADHVASQGQARPSVEDLTSRMRTDSTFNAAVQTAASHNVAVQTVLPPSTGTAHNNVVPEPSTRQTDAAARAAAAAAGSAGSSPIIVNAPAPAPAPAPTPTPAPAPGAPSRVFVGGASGAAPTIVTPTAAPAPGAAPRVFVGGAGGPTLQGGASAQAPRRSPRISERLVDPRVEGQADDRLV